MLSATNFDLVVIASFAAVAYGVASSHVAHTVAGFFARRSDNAQHAEPLASRRELR